MSAIKFFWHQGYIFYTLNSLKLKILALLRQPLLNFGIYYEFYIVQRAPIYSLRPDIGPHINELSKNSPKGSDAPRIGFFCL